MFTVQQAAQLQQAQQQTTQSAQAQQAPLQATDIQNVSLKKNVPKNIRNTRPVEFKLIGTFFNSSNNLIETSSNSKSNFITSTTVVQSVDFIP